MTAEKEDIIKTAIDELTQYAKKKGVHIDRFKDEIRFYGYSKDSSREVQLMLMDSINKRFAEVGLSDRLEAKEV